MALPLHYLHKVIVLIARCVVQNVAWIDLASLSDKRVWILVAIVVLKFRTHARLKVFRVDDGLFARRDIISSKELYLGNWGNERHPIAYRGSLYRILVRINNLVHGCSGKLRRAILLLLGCSCIVLVSTSWR